MESPPLGGGSGARRDPIVDFRHAGIRLFFWGAPAKGVMRRPAEPRCRRDDRTTTVAQRRRIARAVRLPVAVERQARVLQ